jgi:(S)-2-hydroxyglutarate dehydrogenase
METCGYLAQCRKYCPDLSLADLEPGVAGIRAQAVMRDGTLMHDFLFEETARMLHVCNAPSPAATSAIPIGAHGRREILYDNTKLAVAKIVKGGKRLRSKM